MLDEASALTVTAPETVAPAVGDVMETVGGVGFELFTVMDTPALVV